MDRLALEKVAWAVARDVIDDFYVISLIYGLVLFNTFTKMSRLMLLLKLRVK